MIFSFSFLLYVAGAYAQITLEECQRKTQDNYPLVHQYGLVEKTKEYNLENAAKGYFFISTFILYHPNALLPPTLSVGKFRENGAES